MLRSGEVREAIGAPLREILAAITETLEETPPELAGDIARQGILLAGGGTLLRGLAGLVEAETGMPTSVTESPLTCVVVGSGQALEHYDQLAGSATGRRGRGSCSRRSERAGAEGRGRREAAPTSDSSTRGP